MKPRSPIAPGASLAIIGTLLMAFCGGVVVDVFGVLTWRRNPMEALSPQFVGLSIGSVLYGLGMIVAQQGLLRVAAEESVRLVGRVTLGLAALSEIVAGAALILAMFHVHQRFVKIASAHAAPRADQVGRLIADGRASLMVGLVALVFGPILWHLCAGEGFRPATSPHPISKGLRASWSVAFVAASGVAIMLVGTWRWSRGLDQALSAPMPRIGRIAEQLTAIKRLTFIAGMALVALGLAHAVSALLLPSERTQDVAPASTLG